MKTMQGLRGATAMEVAGCPPGLSVAAAKMMDQINSWTSRRQNDCTLIMVTRNVELSEAHVHRYSKWPALGRGSRQRRRQGCRRSQVATVGGATWNWFYYTLRLLQRRPVAARPNHPPPS